MEDTVQTDVIVAGAGMAGLVAGVDLAESGTDVILLEKAPEPGGSMRMSNGIIWTYLPYERLRERAPAGNPKLQRLLADHFMDDLAWLEDLGVDLAEPEFEVEGPGKLIDPPTFADHMVDRFEAAGGHLQKETPLDSVMLDDDGTVEGVTATAPDGEQFEIEAGSVILATGGFQGNERLVEQHITRSTENLYLRSNQWSVGDGLIVARDVGAKDTAGLGTFYGHTMAAPPADVTPETFADATQYYGYTAVALNKYGERFTDESASAVEETLAQDVAQKSDGRAFYVFDDHVADRMFGYTTADGIYENAADLGARTTRADTLAELQEVLTEWGANGRQAVETIREYNEAIRRDRQPDPPRGDERYPLDSPPFRVVEVQAAITFTMGGLDVTAEMAVKRRSTSPSSLALDETDGTDGVIPGLYAAGADVGNIHRRKYVGGLAVGLVSGRVAAAAINSQ